MSRLRLQKRASEPLPQIAAFNVILALSQAPPALAHIILIESETSAPAKRPPNASY